jgi:hypothetical protein
MAGDVAFGTLPGIFTTKRKHITTMTTPICTYVGERLETMWNAVIDFLFVILLNHKGIRRLLGGSKVYLHQR